VERLTLSGIIDTGETIDTRCLSMADRDDQRSASDRSSDPQRRDDEARERRKAFRVI
jgi:hypothetical protein